jgi:hypothetical protein
VCMATPTPTLTAFTLLDEEFLTPEGVARLIGKSTRTVNWWREDRQGPPYVRVGRTILYKKTSVLKWLSDREVTPRKSRKAGARSRQRQDRGS